MINSNVLNVVGEVLESHDIRARTGETLPQTVARALHVSEEKSELWLDALSEGATVEEANDRAGVVPGENEPVMVAIARAVGAFLGKVAG